MGPASKTGRSRERSVRKKFPTSGPRFPSGKGNEGDEKFSRRSLTAVLWARGKSRESERESGGVPSPKLLLDKRWNKRCISEEKERRVVSGEKERNHSNRSPLLRSLLLLVSIPSLLLLHHRLLLFFLQFHSTSW